MKVGFIVIIRVEAYNHSLIYITVYYHVSTRCPILKYTVHSQVEIEQTVVLVCQKLILSYRQQTLMYQFAGIRLTNRQKFLEIDFIGCF